MTADAVSKAIVVQPSAGQSQAGDIPTITITESEISGKQHVRELTSKLHAAIERAAAQGHHKLVLDITELTTVSWHAWRSLVFLVGIFADNKGIRIFLLGMRQELCQIFDLLKFTGQFTLVAAKEEAAAWPK